MKFDDDRISQAYKTLLEEFEGLVTKSDISKSKVFSGLYAELKTMSPEERPAFGKNINLLKQEFDRLVHQSKTQNQEVSPIDISAPRDNNLSLTDLPVFLPVDQGSRHPLTTEIKKITGIFSQMGFETVESLELDDDFHMFESLNFPEEHPARDDFDTFMTEQVDQNGKPFIAPAHTSSMQNRVIKANKDSLEKTNKPIAAVIPGRVFRNEDLDARHEHTFYQLEGLYVGSNVTVGNLMATLKTFLETYYGKSLDFKTQPFYFPFTEPSFEFAMSCPFCDKKGCQVCSYSGFIEILGCGMIHPEVLKLAGLDSNKYSGFAFGVGIDRLVMMKYNIEDVRYFQSARLDFLEQFK